MDSLTNDIKYPQTLSPTVRGDGTAFNIEAHTTSNMKLDRPKVTALASPSLIKPKHLFKPSDAEDYYKKINNDIYEETKKEKTTNEFNFKRYFTIFGIIAIITAAIAYFRKGK